MLIFVEKLLDDVFCETAQLYNIFRDHHIMPSDVGIWDLAISINNKNLLSGDADANKPKERSLVFVGSKGVGKTTLIHR